MNTERGSKEFSDLDLTIAYINGAAHSLGIVVVLTLIVYSCGIGQSQESLNVDQNDISPQPTIVNSSQQGLLYK